MMKDQEFITALLVELEFARNKFPSATFSTIALMEEVGELAQAVLKVRAGNWQRKRIFEEAVQVAAMAMRVALEDDASMLTNYAEPQQQ